MTFSLNTVLLSAALGLGADLEVSGLDLPPKLVLVHGETDAEIAAWAAAYGTNLQDWLDAVLPVLGVSVDDYVLIRLNINVNRPAANVALVRAAQETHPFIDIDDLALLPDGLHYTADTAEQVGLRIAAFLNLYSGRVLCFCTGQSNAGVRLVDITYQALERRIRHYFYDLNQGNQEHPGWRRLGPANGLYGVERSMGANNSANIVQVYKGAAGFANSIGVGQPDFSALLSGLAFGAATVPTRAG